MIHHLLRKGIVGDRHFALGIVFKYALAIGTGFDRSYRDWNFAFENTNLITIGFLKQIHDLSCEIGPFVDHGHEDAINLQVWIDLSSNLSDGPQQ